MWTSDSGKRRLVTTTALLSLATLFSGSMLAHAEPPALVSSEDPLSMEELSRRQEPLVSAALELDKSLGSDPRFVASTIDVGENAVRLFWRGAESSARALGAVHTIENSLSAKGIGLQVVKRKYSGASLKAASSALLRNVVALKKKYGFELYSATDFSPEYDGIRVVGGAMAGHLALDDAKIASMREEIQQITGIEATVVISRGRINFASSVVRR